MSGMPIVADISWPFVGLAIVAAAFVLLWPAYRRYARRINLSWAEGDSAASLDAALELYRSRLPMAILGRRLERGQAEGVIAARWHDLGETDEALAWCERGLKIARKPRTKALLHNLAALTHADRGEIEPLERHLEQFRQLTERHPLADLSYLATAVNAHRRAGQLDQCLALLRAYEQEPGEPLDRALRRAAARTLVCAGRFEEVFRLMPATVGAGAGPPPPDDRGIDLRHTAESSLGVVQVHRSYRRLIELDLAMAGLTAAEAAERWDLLRDYLAVLTAASENTLPPAVRVEAIGFQAILAAVEGRPDEVADCETRLREITGQHPRNRRLLAGALGHVAEARQRLGDHEGAVAAAAQVPADALAPMRRSSLATTSARSLDALGRTEEAQCQRDEAEQLAPLAFWNYPPGLAPLARDADDDLARRFGADAESSPDAPPTELEPVSPVASPVAGAAWLVAVLALLPVVGVIPAVGLAALGIVLLTKPQPLPHDRAVGKAALLIALAVIAFTGAVIVDGVRQARARKAAMDVPPTKLPASAPASSSDAEGADFAGPVDEQDGAAPEHLEIDDEDWAAEPLPWPKKILYLAVLIVSIVLHEVGHAMAALWCGDPTARDRGRISLNPMKHVDPIGSVVVPIVLALLPGGVIIGWAKPVPVRPIRYRHHRRGQLGVTLAGVSLNLMIAFGATCVLTILLIALQRLHREAWVGGLLWPFSPVTLMDVPRPWAWSLALEVCKSAIWLNAILAGFNLLPLPPLDGFGVIQALAPASWAPALAKLSGLGMILLLVLIALNALAWLLAPAIILAAGLVALAAGLGGSGL